MMISYTVKWHTSYQGWQHACKIYSFRYMQIVIMHTNILWECGNIWLQSICNNTAYSGRGQWCASIRGACSLGTMAAPRHSNVEKLLQKIEESQMGYNSTLQGPFGIKRGTCMITCRQIDWTIDLHHMHNSPPYIYTQLCTQITLHLESKCVSNSKMYKSTFWSAAAPHSCIHV